MKSNVIETTLKHPESFHGNDKTLSKMMKMKGEGECHFYHLNENVKFLNITMNCISKLGS